MSLQDDIFDVEDALHGTGSDERKENVEAFRNIMKHIIHLEARIEKFKSKHCPCCGQEKKEANTSEAKWKCTDCLWQGIKKECFPVMYRGTDWRQCPSCRSIAIPLSGE